MNIKKTLSALFVSGALTMATAPHAQQENKVTGFTAKDSLEGFTAKDSREFAGNFTLNDALTPGPAGFWFGSNASQVFRTAIVPRRQPVSMLRSSEMPQIGEIVATTEFGKLSLHEFLNHQLSGTRGFIVVHKGRIVYEQYPGMRDTDSHVTASAAKVELEKNLEILAIKEKENVYKATVSSTQHILNNFLNQLTLVNREINKNPTFDKEVAKKFKSMTEQATNLVAKLASVQKIEAEEIKKSVYPK